jgi:release factor glutamine methyltransferase
LTGVRTAAASVRDALAAATDALTAAGVDSPRLDAELLLEAATGIDRAGLATDPGTPVEPAAGRRFGEMVRRRVRREPVAYILGRKGFREIELMIDRRALIPRPETELLVEVALELGPGSVLDVGTGSGVVALAIADELPDAQVTATDISGQALDLGRTNAVRLGLEGRVSFVAGPPPSGRFDLVVANLPYVTEAEWRELAPEITEYEPREALVAGSDGLDAIRGLLTSPPECDAIALEVGAGQAEAVSGLVSGAGFARIETRHDLVGIERVVLGRSR